MNDFHESWTQKLQHMKDICLLKTPPIPQGTLTPEIITDYLQQIKSYHSIGSSRLLWLAFSPFIFVVLCVQNGLHILKTWTTYRQLQHLYSTHAHRYAYIAAAGHLFMNMLYLPFDIVKDSLYVFQRVPLWRKPRFLDSIHQLTGRNHFLFRFFYAHLKETPSPTHNCYSCKTPNPLEAAECQSCQAPLPVLAPLSTKEYSRIAQIFMASAFLSVFGAINYVLMYGLKSSFWTLEIFYILVGGTGGFWIATRGITPRIRDVIITISLQVFFLTTFTYHLDFSFYFTIDTVATVCWGISLTQRLPPANIIPVVNIGVTYFYITLCSNVLYPWFDSHLSYNHQPQVGLIYAACIISGGLSYLLHRKEFLKKAPPTRNPLPLKSFNTNLFFHSYIAIVLIWVSKHLYLWDIVLPQALLHSIFSMLAFVVSSEAVRLCSTFIFGKLQNGPSIPKLGDK